MMDSRAYIGMVLWPLLQSFYKIHGLTRSVDGSSHEPFGRSGSHAFVVGDADGAPRAQGAGQCRIGAAALGVSGALRWAEGVGPEVSM